MCLFTRGSEGTEGEKPSPGGLVWGSQRKLQRQRVPRGYHSLITGDGECPSLPGNPKANNNPTDLPLAVTAGRLRLGQREHDSPASSIRGEPAWRLCQSHATTKAALASVSVSPFATETQFSSSPARTQRERNSSEINTQVSHFAANFSEF